MSVESPIFTRKLKILPKASNESDSSAWTENEISQNVQSSQNELNTSGYYELETFLPNSKKANKTKRLKNDVAIAKTSANDVKVRQIYADGFGGINIYKKFDDKSINKNLKSFYLNECCPWTTPWILLTNSMVQIIIYFVGNDDIFEKLIYSPIRRKEIWRYLTYNFLHSDTVHLFLNVFIQLLVSFPLETEQGHFKVLIVYFVGVISGALGASVFQPTLLMVGASAGVYSLLVSHVSHISLNFSELKYRYFRIASVIVLCISDIMFVINHCMTRGNSEPKISISAHTSGAISGLLLGFVIYSGSSSHPPLIFRVIRYLSIILCTVFILAFIYFSNINSDL